MVGKPVLARETDALTAAGLQVVSWYQFGKGGTADGRGAREAGKRHASRGLELHAAAGGPSGRPIYASIDDNPTSTEITTLISPLTSSALMEIVISPDAASSQNRTT